MKPLSHQELLNAVNYDPETGIFTRKNQSGTYAAGGRLGYIRPSGYTAINVAGRTYSASKLAWLYMTGEWPPGKVININGDGGDNRFANLRLGKTKEALTAERLRQLLDYDPESGLFTWVFNRPRCKAGAIAGCENDRGYISIGVDGKFYLAHRLAFLWMTDEWPQYQVDHINHVKTDNRWANLSNATNQENQRNAPLRSDNKTGITGVYLSPKTNKYHAYITVDRVNIQLYSGDSFDEACTARKAAEKEHGFHENHGAS